MSSRLLIDGGIGELRAAHIIDERLTALHIHYEEKPDQLGNIYGARVIRAGQDQDLFLDLGNGSQAHMSKRRAKADGRKSLPDEGAFIRVQITRDVEAGKLAQASTRLRLAGRYVVLDRRTSQGFITRRNHDGMEAEKARLSERYAALNDNPGLLYQAPHGLEEILMNCGEVDEILISDPALFAQAQHYCTHWADLRPLLKRAFDTSSLFTDNGIDEEIEASLSGRIALSQGAWISITQSDALCAIDVNAGERDALDTNITAAREIARQLLLQNIGGLIVIDFIDMQEKGAWNKVLKSFDEAVQSDKARIRRSSASQFGLVEVQREKTGPSLPQRLLAKTVPQPRPAYSGHEALRHAKQLGLSHAPGKLLIEAPKDVLDWLNNNRQFIDALTNQTKRPVISKLSLTVRVTLIDKADP